MISPGSFRDFFIEIKEIEDEMSVKIEKLLTLIKREDIRKQLMIIRDDENKHSNLVDECLSLVDKK